MAVSGVTRAILVHGLPDLGCDDPITSQFAGIQAVCSGRGIGIDGYRWAGCSRRDIARAFMLLRSERESFTATHATSFRDWLAAHVATIPAEENLALIAFSAGGAIVYRWLRDHATDAELHRLAVAIVIATPHTFPNPGYLEAHPETAIPVNEPAIPPADLLGKLAGSGTPLKVVLGEGDLTVPVEYGAFPSAPEVEQVVIRFARHSTICSHPRCLELIDGWLA